MLPENRYDVLVPSEVGYELPEENLESEATRGLEAMLSFSDRAGDVSYSFGANATYARRRIPQAHGHTAAKRVRDDRRLGPGHGGLANADHHPLQRLAGRRSDRGRGGRHTALR